jgi:hypothetical protein
MTSPYPLVTRDTRIAAAAVRLNVPSDLGAVKAGDPLILTMPPPARHHTILHAMASLGMDHHVTPADQGFILSDGTWADRKRALEIATAAGQLVQNPSADRCPISPPNLFSEDMW